MIYSELSRAPDEAARGGNPAKPTVSRPMREFWIGFFIVMAMGVAGALIYFDWLRESEDVLIERVPAQER